MKTDAINAAMLEPILSRARTSAYAEKSPGQAPWRVKKNIIPAIIERHLAGGKALGVYPMEPGATTTRIALLDFDSHGGETAWPNMVAVAKKVISALQDHFLDPVPFRSTGGNGIHLYVLWGEPQDARSVRGLLAEALEACGYKSGTAGVSKGEIEIFPKQNKVDAEGYGNMFIVPWSGKSCALHPETLEAITPMQTIFEISADVPVLPPEPERQLVASSGDADIEQLRALLAAIPNTEADELSYSDWRDIVFAVHYTTSGSDEGLALVHEFSQRSSKYNELFLDERVWPYIRDDKSNPITIRTIMHHASAHGWSEDVTDKFDVLGAKDAGQDEDAGADDALVYEEEPQWPRLTRDKKGILATVNNLEKALLSRAMIGVRIAYDSFKDEMMYVADGETEWRPFKDSDYWRLRSTLESRGFHPVNSTIIREAVNFVGDENHFDSAMEWLNVLQYDGVSRIDTFLTDYFSVPDSAYTRAVSRYMWTGMAGRVLSPGIQLDMVPVMVGEEGAGKTTGIKALVPIVTQYAEIAFTNRNEDTSRRMRGILVGEIGELKGLQTADEESILTFITRTHEDWIPKFKEFGTKFARRMIMIGTTNIREFLDPGRRNRRWLPLDSGKVDVHGIIRDREQLWAEARDLYLAHGIMWKDAQDLSEAEHTNYQISDGWEQAVIDWLRESELGSETPRGGAYEKEQGFQLESVLRGALSMGPKEITKGHQRRMGSILKKLGYVNAQHWRNGHNCKVWFRSRKKS